MPYFDWAMASSSQTVTVIARGTTVTIQDLDLAQLDNGSNGTIWHLAHAVVGLVIIIPPQRSKRETQNMESSLFLSGTSYEI